MLALNILYGFTRTLNITNNLITKLALFPVSACPSLIYSWFIYNFLFKILFRRYSDISTTTTHFPSSPSHPTKLHQIRSFYRRIFHSAIGPLECNRIAILMTPVIEIICDRHGMKIALATSPSTRQTKMKYDRFPTAGHVQRTRKHI